MIAADLGPSGIVDLIKLGGPAGAGVVLIWLFAPRARDAYKNADDKTRPLMRFAEPVCWACGLMLVLASTYIYVKTPEIVKGTLAPLKGEQSLWATGDNIPLYFSRSNRAGSTTKSIGWLIYGDKVNDGAKIDLTIAGTKDEADRLFQMEMLSEFYDGKEVDIRVQYPNKVTLTHGKTTKTYDLTVDSDFLEPTKTSSLLPAITIVHAAVPPLPPAETIRLLETDDPAVRKSARDAVVKSDKDTALAVVDTVAKDPARSYRAWIGALTILNQNPGIAKPVLSADALQALVGSVATPGTDPTVIAQAKGYMIAHSTEQIETALRLEFKARSSSGTKPADMYELTDTFFGVLYNMGVSEKDQYQGPDAKSQVHFGNAVSKFEEAWGMKPWAAQWHAAQYPKALYGWALMLQDRATLDARATGAANKKETAAARDKFEQFLKEAAGVSYPAKYAENLATAKKYIAEHS